MPTFSLITKAGQGRSATKDADRQRTYTVPYQVESDDPAGSEAEVLTYVEGQVGLIGTAHPDDDGAFLRSIRIQEDADDGCSWSVTCEYGPWEAREESPLDEPPEVSIDWAPRERIAERDYNGVAVVNSANDPFDPAIVRDDTRVVIRVSTNEAIYPLQLASAYRDTVNDAAVTIDGVTFAAKTIKAAAPKARRQYHPSVGFYWRIDYEFEIAPETWVHKQIDNGFRYLASATVRKQALTDDGQPVSAPVLLDGSGGRLAPNGTPVVLEFDLYEPKDFQAGFTFFT